MMYSVRASVSFFAILLVRSSTSRLLAHLLPVFHQRGHVLWILWLEFETESKHASVVVNGISPEAAARAQDGAEHIRLGLQSLNPFRVDAGIERAGGMGVSTVSLLGWQLAGKL
jgi:hypothetical protein